MTQPILVSEADQTDSRRVLKLAGGGAVLLLLIAFVVPKFVFGGGDDGASAPVAAAPTTPSTVAPGPGDAGDDAPETDASFSSKNPFVALVSDAPAGPAAGGNVATPAVDPGVPLPAVPLPVGFPTLPSIDPPVTAPAPVPPVAGAPSPAPAPTTPAPAPAPRAARQFTLVEIYTDGTGLVAATIKIDTTSYAVAVGQDFAGYYRALALDRISQCGVFLYGDRRFSLCQGETTTT